LQSDLLLFAGCAIVAWVAGIEMGAKMMADLTPPLSALATQLAELHHHHQEAKAKMQAANDAKAVVEKQLAAHIKKLQEEFSI
jgi:outer membrane murein-binding lipoprotein Lpp